MSERLNETRSSSGASEQSHVGFLTDHQITSLLESGKGFTTGTWERNQVRHASYMLRLGSAHRRVQRSIDDEDNNFSVVSLQQGQDLSIPPRSTALLYSIEQFLLPPEIMIFTVARGLLQAEGLAPSNTYADPGFTGSLYTAVTNLTDREVRIPYGSTIARVFFYRLSQPVTNVYRTGTALGIDQQLKLTPRVPRPSQTELRHTAINDLLSTASQTELGALVTGELYRRLRIVLWSLVSLTLIWPLLLVIANTKWARTQVGAFSANVIAGVIATLLVAGFQILHRRRS